MLERLLAVNLVSTRLPERRLHLLLQLAGSLLVLEYALQPLLPEVVRWPVPVLVML